MRIVCCLFTLLWSGCSASFVDLNPPTAQPADAALPAADLLLTSPPIGDLSGAPPGDMAAGDLLAPGEPGRVLAMGTFEGRAGHGGRGGGSLFLRPDGQVEVRMAADFGVTGAVGPVVVLTTRLDLGNTLRPEQGDLELSALRKTSGEQAYPIPGGDGGRRVIFVWCMPFKVEIARAVLEPQP